MNEKEQNIIIYNTTDGKASVSLYAKDGMMWMNQNQLAELFDTSVPNISMHTSNILKEQELELNSIVKDYFTTASDGKEYKVTLMKQKVNEIYAFSTKKEKPLKLNKLMNKIWKN